MNTSNNKRNALLALFINKNNASGERPTIEEVDKWRLGNIKGPRSDEIKQFIANDNEVYQWWQQLRQEAKTTDVETELSFVTKTAQIIKAALSKPVVMAPALLSVMMVYVTISLLQMSTTNILQLASDDMDEWQKITKLDKSFQLGMTRQWKSNQKKSKPSDNMMYFQIGLNQFLKTPIHVDYSSTSLCQSDDEFCKERQAMFTLMGQWVSKANVICQQNNLNEKVKIDNRLAMWERENVVMKEKPINSLFKTWRTADKAIDPCIKIQELIFYGANA